MTATAAVSVATFSQVLAEAFAAVTLTSVQTNMLIQGLRRTREQARALQAMNSTTAPPAPPAPPAAAPAGAPLTATTLGPALGDVGVDISPSPVGPGGQLGPTARLDPATLRMIQAWARNVARNPLAEKFAEAVRNGMLGDLLTTVARQIGIAVQPGEATVDLARAVFARLGATLQGGQAVGAEVAQLVQAVAAMGAGSDEVDLFVARSAKIHAEFEFQASDEFRVRAGQVGEQGGMLGALQIVSLAPGFSALYQSTSRNRITLDVEFALTNVRL
jgi:hypothetical protein